MFCQQCTSPSKNQQTKQKQPKKKQSKTTLQKTGGLTDQEMDDLISKAGPIEDLHAKTKRKEHKSYY